MRVGFNPNKDKISDSNEFWHQLIIPVHIPHQQDYFKDSFQIFKYCLESLFKTCHKQTYISIVNNGSCELVVEYLNGLYQEAKIQEVIHTTAVGKINAILKALSGQNFELITIADADVLFLNDWQKETYEVLENFSKAGAISPVPSSKTLKQFTYPLLIEKIFSKQLQFTEVKNPKAMIKFAQSIGNPNFYNETHLKYNLTIANGNNRAVVGAGHFVTTYRGEIFNKLNERYSSFGLGGNSEHNFLDEPVANQGYWRLATENNFAYHMGNVLEPWMLKQLNELKDESDKEVFFPVLKKGHSFKFWNTIKEKVVWRILMKKKIWLQFLKWKGLDKETAKKY